MDWFDRLRERSRRRREAMYNPHSPDNMLVRNDALRAGETNPSAFPALQKRIRRLARKRQAMEARGELPMPTPEERKAFDAELEKRGL